VTASRRQPARGPVDWAELRRRLEEVQERALVSASPAQVRELLRERARLLAQPPATDDMADAVEHVTFRLGSEQFGLESRFVLEVLGRSRLTPLPRVAPPVVGVTGWRGDVLTVMDLRLVLQAGGPATDAVIESPPILVIGDNHRRIGVVVTEILDLQHVRPGDLKPAGAQGERPWLCGITPEAISILDAAVLIRQLTEGAPL
jgi:purine-binding chemotaxis protein CheW